MKVIQVSAPGKVILAGDHAVVYGKPAIVSAIAKRLSVTIKSNSKKNLTIKASGHEKYIKDTYNFLKTKFNISDENGVHIEVDTELKTGFHLGSSAAFAVSFTGAFLYYFKSIWNPKLINDNAYELEKIKHGNPSGVDNSACTYGGFMWYRKELEILKSLWQLPFKLKQSVNNFYLLNGGIPSETTFEMVSRVKKDYISDVKKYDQIFNDNEKYTKELGMALYSGQEDQIIDSIKKGTNTHIEMGVVSRCAQNTIKKVESLGGAIKILGGGGVASGVGYMLAYLPKGSVKKYSDLDFEKVELGEEGVRLEKK